MTLDEITTGWAWGMLSTTEFLDHFSAIVDGE